MTAGRDPLDALEDIVRNLALARDFIGKAVTAGEPEADPKTVYSVVRALAYRSYPASEDRRAHGRHGAV